ncbi:hypothetical protein OOU_Y34scaffold00793g40 [Pyricularia oryzae Y34]|uniref:Uncharacterized protein n=3 Tax=Pyricularia oryzae TaxID=318829 RepID=A0A4P7NLX4_PYROR|nr:hypothetical protein OOU_Y34scaffold00793g40 [Pyricularia oryzae Y34]QBZ63174.1 hypothetical protein PoMZ_12071 [Pyricularia oryzae]
MESEPVKGLSPGERTQAVQAGQSARVKTDADPNDGTPWLPFPER